MSDWARYHFILHSLTRPNRESDLIILFYYVCVAKPCEIFTHAQTTKDQQQCFSYILMYYAH